LKHKQFLLPIYKKIDGNWEGQLTYTDYKDDLSQSILACEMIAKCKYDGSDNFFIRNCYTFERKEE
jgi:hypothetical protein